MIKHFERAGIRFQYPTNWTLESEDSAEGWTISVHSPATAFLVVSFHSDTDEPAELADSALAAMRENYPELESTMAIETIAGQPSIGHDVDFFALDLTNSCSIRAMQAREGCLLLLSQCTDDELEANGRVLQAIRASLQIEDD